LIDVLQILSFRVGHAVRVSVYRERPPSAPAGLVTAVSDSHTIPENATARNKKSAICAFLSMP